MMAMKLCATAAPEQKQSHRWGAELSPTDTGPAAAG
jgi:hypothetical protein